MLKLLALALVVSGSLAAAGPGKKDEKQAVEGAVEKLRKAMIDPTQTSLDAIAADQLSYGHSNGLIEDKSAFMKALLSGDNDFKTIDLSEQSVSIIDNTAMVRHKLMAETNNKGVPGQAKLAVLLVFVKQKGDWRLLARQAVKI
ncbi:nuclear transport factor 2 family protein [Larkinella soli]|uniref:nuclear transport factor 2 family protein n=1 Tax=Larkinella soli TaxID=1770527 RepID=UPI001E393E51|nr:nuclear transport factor 2 family protein [Larkinella soli]